MAALQDQKYAELGLEKSVSSGGGVSAYHRHLQKAETSNPVLLLIHGYPQSAYE
jgi:hypothetical protein